VNVCMYVCVYVSVYVCVCWGGGERECVCEREYGVPYPKRVMMRFKGERSSHS